MSFVVTQPELLAKAVRRIGLVGSAAPASPAGSFTATQFATTTAMLTKCTAFGADVTG